MFTGIISELGRIEKIETVETGKRFRIRCPKIAKGLKLGDSIAVNGCCLTAVKLSKTGFEAEAVPETLRRTNLGELEAGSPVNLERPMRVGGSLDGHIVTGHIDGQAELRKVTEVGMGYEIELKVPAKLAKLIVEKGSVALDGISLTVAGIAGTKLKVAIIPHTWASTNLHAKPIGAPVNIETDILAKHVAKLIGARV